MFAIYSLVSSIFCPSSVFFVVHGAPLEVPSFLYYLVQFGAAALHFRFRFQWLFRCPLPLSLSLSLLLFDWLWAWRPLIHPPVDDSSESHPAPTWGICWALAAQRQLVPYHQAAIVAKSRRLSVVTFPIPHSLFLLPSSLRLFFILRCNFPCLYCLSRILQLRVRNCPPEYAFSGTVGWSLWPWNVVTWLTGLRSHALTQHNNHSILDLCF